jgi:hypothetical protein
MSVPVGEAYVQERYFILETDKNSGMQQVVMQGSFFDGKPYMDQPSSAHLTLMLFESRQLAEYYIKTIEARWPDDTKIYSAQKVVLEFTQPDPVKILRDVIPLKAVEDAQRVLQEYGYDLMQGDVERLLQLLPYVKRSHV